MKAFALNGQPVDYILTVHMNNLDIYLSKENNSFKAEWSVYQAFGIEAVSHSAQRHIQNLVSTYGEASINNFFALIVKRIA